MLTAHELIERLHARATITSFAHLRPDPMSCDGTTCRSDGIEVAQASCPHLLRMNIEVEVSTEDGAVKAMASGEAVQWAQGFEAMIGEGTADYPIAHAYADLRDVHGSLQLSPELSTPYEGTLVIVLELEDDAPRGALSPMLVHVAMNDDGGITARDEHRPLIGYFPESSAIEPGAEADAGSAEPNVEP